MKKPHNTLYFCVVESKSYNSLVESTKRVSFLYTFWWEKMNSVYLSDWKNCVLSVLAKRPHFVLVIILIGIPVILNMPSTKLDVNQCPDMPTITDSSVSTHTQKKKKKQSWNELWNFLEFVAISWNWKPQCAKQAHCNIERVIYACVIVLQDLMEVQYASELRRDYVLPILFNVILRLSADQPAKVHNLPNINALFEIIFNTLGVGPSTTSTRIEKVFIFCFSNHKKSYFATCLHIFSIFLNFREIRGIFSFPENYLETIRISRNSGNFLQSGNTDW